MHTKGPWRVEENDADENIGPYRIESDAVTIAMDVSGIGVEAEANARLISAAPDMYEALRNLVDCAGLTWLDGYKSELDAAMMDAHAALNKAEGRNKE